MGGKGWEGNKKRGEVKGRKTCCGGQRKGELYRVLEKRKFEKSEGGKQKCGHQVLRFW